MVGTLFKGVFVGLSVILTERLAQVGTTQLRKRLFHRSLALELEQFHQEEASQLMSRLTNDLEQVCEGLRSLFGRTLGEPLKMAVCLAGAACVCWRLLLISLIVSPLALLVIARLSRSLKRANRRTLEEMSSIYAVLADSLRGIKIVKAFTMERLERRRADHASRRLAAKSMRVAVYDALVRPCLETMGMVIVCIAVLVGAYLVLNEQTHLLGVRISHRPLSVSSMMLFFGFLAGTSDPARKLSGILGRLQRGAAAADRVYELLDRRSTLVASAAAPSLAAAPPSDPFPGRAFRLCRGNTRAARHRAEDPRRRNGGHRRAERLWQEHAGRSAAAVLRSAAGRDSRRRPRPATGECPRTAATGGTGDAGPVLFNDTVEANIRVARPNATRDEIVQAARRAQADSFIRHDLPQGYRTVVGEGASRLSGGQKQRIALARAILRDPRILVLDEATSQVDLESEQQIHAVLSEFIRGRTTLIITHRLSILHLAHRILVMDRGRIIDSGSYDELLASSEPFRRLCQVSSRHAA